MLLWQRPCFLTMSQASFQFLSRVMKTNIIMVFISVVKMKQSMNDIFFTTFLKIFHLPICHKSKFTLLNELVLYRSKSKYCEICRRFVTFSVSSEYCKGKQDISVLLKFKLVIEYAFTRAAARYLCQELRKHHNKVFSNFSTIFHLYFLLFGRQDL